VISAEDRLAILDMVSLADDYATARDADGYLSLFADDATIGGSEGSYSGADAIRDGVREVWAKEPPGTHHLSCTVSVSAIDDDSAAARFTLLLAGGAPPAIIAIVEIEQRFRRTARGWLIASRDIRG
jgi:uncharacterized protein (TIGR02246 family)